MDSNDCVRFLDRSKVRLQTTDCTRSVAMCTEKGEKHVEIASSAWEEERISWFSE